MDGWTLSECLNQTAFPRLDSDQDGIADECESSLAYYFRPNLHFTSDCIWDPTYSRLGGDYLYAVDHAWVLGNGDLRITYLFAYYWDCGNEDGGFEHSGDSEFIIIDLKYNASNLHWEVDQVKLSSHCGEPTGQACRWYQPNELSWVNDTPNPNLGAPQVWVAILKHANYPSDAACDKGAALSDDCVATMQVRYPFTRGYYGNIGSRSFPYRDCAGPLRASSLTVPGKVECFWTHVPGMKFDGWQDQFGLGSTSYGNILATHAYW